MSPLQEFRSFDHAVDRLLRSTIHSNLEQPWLPTDIFEKDGTLMIRAAVPGIDPETIQISVENRVLTLTVESRDLQLDDSTKVYQREIRYGQMNRSVRLPEGADIENISADVRNGELTIRVPKRAEMLPRSIKVNVQSLEENAS
jgi:HSP20 family protein